MATETRWIQGQVSGGTDVLRSSSRSQHLGAHEFEHLKMSLRVLRDEIDGNGPQSGPRQEQGWLTYRWTDGMAEKAGSA
jgi:hypothetical protein